PAALPNAAVRSVSRSGAANGERNDMPANAAEPGAPLAVIDTRASAPAPPASADAARTWRLRIERPGWTPEVVTATLVIGAREGRRAANLFFNEVGSRSAVPLDVAPGGAGEFDATFDFVGEPARLHGGFDPSDRKSVV